ncbi:hypothetical protein LIA77_06054 [Sarocladium implicatum]|nr:hypothetical protein LIA77_06054 [Sarocladium implicatum]
MIRWACRFHRSLFLFSVELSRGIGKAEWRCMIPSPAVAQRDETHLRCDGCLRWHGMGWRYTCISIEAHQISPRSASSRTDVDHKQPRPL